MIFVLDNGNPTAVYLVSPILGVTLYKNFPLNCFDKKRRSHQLFFNVSLFDVSACIGDVADIIYVTNCTATARKTVRPIAMHCAVLLNAASFLI